MSTKILFLFLLIGVSFGKADDDSQAKYSVGIHVARTSYPAYFYDYWKPGFGITVQRFGERLDGKRSFVMVEAGWHALDSDRLLQYNGALPSETTITGGSAILLSCSYGLNYAIQGYTDHIPGLFGGIGIAFSGIFGSTIAYPLRSESQGFRPGLSVIAPLGVTLETMYRSTLPVIIMGKVQPGIGLSSHSLYGTTALSVSMILP